ncbi:hypothetical protein TRIUR3_19996 [Triticum urartu]|uniref:Uncharacterized protein n=1 Tax=Triticum urartu TaxID=4572 RepID=M8AG64_TRIUA|nr:hypothetical protein TRIUR3_19996 [Triticum urartu]
MAIRRGTWLHGTWVFGFAGLVLATVVELEDFGSWVFGDGSRSRHQASRYLAFLAIPKSGTSEMHIHGVFKLGLRVQDLRVSVVAKLGNVHRGTVGGVRCTEGRRRNMGRWPWWSSSSKGDGGGVASGGAMQRRPMEHGGAARDEQAASSSGGLRRGEVEEELAALGGGGAPGRRFGRGVGGRR